MGRVKTLPIFFLENNHIFFTKHYLQKILLCYYAFTPEQMEKKMNSTTIKHEDFYPTEHQLLIDADGFVINTDFDSQERLKDVKIIDEVSFGLITYTFFKEIK